MQSCQAPRLPPLSPLASVRSHKREIGRHFGVISASQFRAVSHRSEKTQSWTGDETASSLFATDRSGTSYLQREKKEDTTRQNKRLDVSCSSPCCGVSQPLITSRCILTACSLGARPPLSRSFAAVPFCLPSPQPQRPPLTRVSLPRSSPDTVIFLSSV